MVDWGSFTRVLPDNNSHCPMISASGPDETLRKLANSNYQSIYHLHFIKNLYSMKLKLEPWSCSRNYDEDWMKICKRYNVKIIKRIMSSSLANTNSYTLTSNTRAKNPAFRPWAISSNWTPVKHQVLHAVISVATILLWLNRRISYKFYQRKCIYFCPIIMTQTLSM